MLACLLLLLLLLIWLYRQLERHHEEGQREYSERFDDWLNGDE